MMSEGSEPDGLGLNSSPSGIPHLKTWASYSSSVTQFPLGNRTDNSIYLITLP